MYATADSALQYRGRVALGVRERREERFDRSRKANAPGGSRHIFATDRPDHWGARVDAELVPARYGVRLAATVAGRR
jgi:hypothetical protein